jgi:hypothetical protein
MGVVTERYSPADLDRMATALLEDDMRAELCRECDHRGVEFGDPIPLVIYRDGVDTGLRALAVCYICENGHTWHSGEGKARGRGGENAILLADHMEHRRSHELAFVDDIDTVTPGMFHRPHVPKSRPHVG